MKWFQHPPTHLFLFSNARGPCSFIQLLVKIIFLQALAWIRTGPKLNHVANSHQSASHRDSSIPCMLEWGAIYLTWPAHSGLCRSVGILPLDPLRKVFNGALGTESQLYCQSSYSGLGYLQLEEGTFSNSLALSPGHHPKVPFLNFHKAL